MKFFIIIAILFCSTGIAEAIDTSVTITEQWQSSGKNCIPLLKQKLKSGTPAEKEEVLNIFRAYSIAELVPDVINAILDDAVSPRHGDTGWGNVYHQAATALCQYAYKIDGVTQKERGYKQFSFYDDAGTAPEERRKEVYENWLQWWKENRKDIEKKLRTNLVNSDVIDGTAGFKAGIDESRF